MIKLKDIHKTYENSFTYREYLEGLNKDELVHLIIGDDENPPLLTTKEKKYSRPQLIWAITRFGGTLEDAETKIDAYISAIEGFKWDIFYRYDFFRFDIRKPSFLVFLIGFVFSVFGAAFCLYEFTLNIVEFVNIIFE